MNISEKMTSLTVNPTQTQEEAHWCIHEFMFRMNQCIFSLLGLTWTYMVYDVININTNYHTVDVEYVDLTISRLI